jgi:hypothetical protein
MYGCSPETTETLSGFLGYVGRFIRRAHRSQGERKRPFTSAELAARGL